MSEVFCKLGSTDRTGSAIVFFFKTAVVFGAEGFRIPLKTFRHGIIPIIGHVCKNDLCGVIKDLTGDGTIRNEILFIEHE